MKDEWRVASGDFAGSRTASFRGDAKQSFADVRSQAELGNESSSPLVTLHCFFAFATAYISAIITSPT